MLVIGNDHGGTELKNELIKYLQNENIEFLDLGINDNTSVDYPDYAKLVVNYIKNNNGAKGLLICGTGIGISISANRYKGIRAAICHDVFSAKATREHNDANIIVMGGRVVGPGHAIEILKTFLNTEYSNEERHTRRINKIDE